MNKQCTHTIFMVEPVAFSFNEQTATNNYFQQKNDLPERNIQNQALNEFSTTVEQIRAMGVDVMTVKSGEDTPDSIFPNNWVSFHSDGTVVLYPMFAPNRRKERCIDIINLLKGKGFWVKNIVDYSEMEHKGKYLEGTGSMVLDRINQVVYATISERTDEELLDRFCTDFNYQLLTFHAKQSVEMNRMPIYHTNVMMSLAENYALVCIESIDDTNERKLLQKTIESSGIEIITISERQMQHFAGNCIQVEGNQNEKLLIISETGYLSLTTEQKKRIAGYNEIVSVAIPTIEKHGGGSIRCMIAEIFLPRKI